MEHHTQVQNRTNGRNMVDLAPTMALCTFGIDSTLVMQFLNTSYAVRMVIVVSSACRHLHKWI